MTGVNAGLAVAVRRWGKGKVDETYGTCAGPSLAAGYGQVPGLVQITDKRCIQWSCWRAGGCRWLNTLSTGTACSLHDILYHWRTEQQHCCSLRSLSHAVTSF